MTWYPGSQVAWLDMATALKARIKRAAAPDHGPTYPAGELVEKSRMDTTATAARHAQALQDLQD